MAVLLAGNLILPLYYQEGRTAITALDYLCVHLLAFTTTALAWRRARREGPPAFYLLGLGAGLGSLQYLPTLFRLPNAAILGPAISIAGFLFLGAGFLWWPQQIRMPRDRMRVSLDGLSIALSVFALAWLAMGLLPWSSRTPRAVTVTYAIHISAALGVLSLWLLQETRLMLPEQAPAKRFVRLAMVLLLARVSLAAFLKVLGHYQGYLAHGAEALHQVANVLLALAALSPPARPGQAPSGGARSHAWATVPSLLSLAVLLLLGLRIYFGGGEPPRPLLGMGLALVLVVALRHGLLIRDLERFSRDLESRVEARTRELEQHHREALGDLRVRMMAGLAAGLAHDLNNILGVIRLRLDLLRETSAPRQLENLEVLREASERAIAMTQRILSSGRAENLSPMPFCLTDWMGTRSGLLRALLGPGQNLIIRSAPQVAVVADPQSLDQVLQNLVSNARDAMGPAGTLTITLGAGPGQALVEVRDDGPGFPPEHMARLFEPFFTTKPSGTGLGLATVRNLVHQNRGTIRVESGEGQGTAFFIGLPAATEPPLLA
ncbi:MAG TPA: HAMP domain-containing sensor histidine kinase [Geothrix sp.]|nr:HAMP domain-containing sensor histidine kinase [Geothrix sp.]